MGVFSLCDTFSPRISCAGWRSILRCCIPRSCRRRHANNALILLPARQNARGLHDVARPAQTSVYIYDRNLRLVATNNDGTLTPWAGSTPGAHVFEGASQGLSATLAPVLTAALQGHVLFFQALLDGRTYYLRIYPVSGGDGVVTGGLLICEPAAFRVDISATAITNTDAPEKRARIRASEARPLQDEADLPVVGAPAGESGWASEARSERGSDGH